MERSCKFFLLKEEEECRRVGMIVDILPGI